MKLNAGEDTGNAKHVIEVGPQPFTSFNSDRHPVLVQAIKTIKLWFNERREAGGAVMLVGNTGCGKTHIVTDIKNYVGYGCVMYNENKLIKDIQGTYGQRGGKTEQQIINQCNRADLLIFDDLGTYQTDNLEWVQNIYYELFNDRLENKKPVMLTTNLAMGNNGVSPLCERLGQRVFSRLLGALDDPKYCINLFGVPDYRMRKW